MLWTIFSDTDQFQFRCSLLDCSHRLVSFHDSLFFEYGLVVQDSKRAWLLINGQVFW